MNKAYKIVFNKHTNQLVVVSELAKGNKKTRSSKTVNVPKQLMASMILAMSSGVGGLATAYAADATVNPSYTSGALIKNGSGTVTGIDSTDSASYKGKNQVFNAGSNTFSLNNAVKWLPDPEGPKTPIPIEYKPASTLAELGALTVTDKSNNNAVVNPLPTFQDWNLAQKQDTITWVKEDGSTGTTTVYNVDGIDTQGNIDTATNFTAQIITGQPTEPFVDLRIATATGSGTTLDIKADEKIDWKPGQVKQSSLFAAEDKATINQNQDIKVTFAYTESVSNPADAEKKGGDFGPSKQLSGSTITFQGQSFTIDSKASLDSYNNALIAAIKNNSLAATDYDAEINKAFKAGDKIYHYEYDPLALNYDAQGYYFSDAMKAAVGKRAIFEANTGGVVNLNGNVEAIGDTWHHAYNVWAHDKGVVNNNGEVTVASPYTQNALIESGSTFTNTGVITFDAKGSNGKNVTNWADQVTGANSTYTNEGSINISNAEKNSPSVNHPNEYYKLSRSIATEVLDGATATNTKDGVYNIGSTSGTAEGTATGVHIKNSGSFTNEGEMNVISTTGGAKDDNLDLNNTNNAISAIADNSGTTVRINNDGTINIAENAVNSAGINIAQSTAGVKNLQVVNNDTINVGGKNSAGIKVAGDIKEANGNSISNKGTINVTNSGSAGIFAASGAEVINEGDISVVGKDDASARVYGIKNDNAKVTLKSGSNITVEGSYSTGLYARTGGEIIVEDGAEVDVPADPNAKQQVVFWVSGKNSQGQSSKIEFLEPAAFDLDNQSSTLFRVDNGATYDGSTGSLTANVNGSNSNGYTVATKGTTFDSGTAVINVVGDNSTGLNINSGAGTDDKVKLNANTKISVTGNGATVATVDGNTYDLLGNKTGQDGAKLISEAVLSSSGSNATVAANAIGYKVVNKGELVQKGSIDFSTANNTTGVYIDGGTLTNEGQIKSNGIGIDVYQTNPNTPSKVSNNSDITAVDGTAAIRLNENASLTVGGKGVIKGENSADAIRVMAGSNLSTENANIAVDGTGSGIHFLNTSGDAAGTFKLSGTGTITVSGDNAAGITLEGQDSAGNPTMSNSNLDTRGSEGLVINVNDKGGNGIVTNTSGTVKSGTSVNINSSEGQSALVVKGTTTDIEQTGNLTSNSTTSAVVDLTQTQATSAIKFVNSGQIKSNGGTLAVDATGQTVAVTVENTVEGKILGGVKLGDAANTVLLENKSTADKITAGNGNNQITVKDKASVDEISAGNGDNIVNLQNESKTGTLALGDGKNNITVSNGATISGAITAGDGDNIVNLKDTSKTNQVALGNGTNTVNIYGGTDNGTISSGSGKDSYTLINTTKDGSSKLFDQIDGGTGDDVLTLNNSYYQMTSVDQVKNFENLHVTDGSTFEVNNVDLQLLGDGVATNVVDLDKGGTYFINFDKTSSDYVLDQSIKGAGTIKTDTNGKAFDFGNADYTQNNFTGTLALGNGTFAIEGDNTKALTNATLQLDQNGIATVKADNGVQKMGGLTFNDGTLNFEKSFIGSKEQQLDSHIEVKDLDVSKNGTVNLVTNGFDNDYNEDDFLEDVNNKTLLEQDDGINLVTLVKATNSVTGDAANITVNMIDATSGQPTEQPNSKQDIRQNDSVVAIGSYGIGASTYNENGVQDGLYAAYILQQVAIKDGETLNLETTPTSTGKGEDFRARITDLDGGSGNIEINSTNNSITLSNSANDYTGTTTVAKGKLNLGGDTVLGQKDKHTSNLILKENTQVNFNATTQYVGQVNTETTSTLALDKGTLNVDNGGTVNGHITSDQLATLNVNGGTLNVNGANQAYHGQTNIVKDAIVNINSTQGLGDGDIDLAGDLNINNASGTFANNLSNNGNANINGTSDVVLADDNNAFTGNFNIADNAALTASATQHLGQSVVNNEGKLTLTGSEDWTVNNIVQGTGDVFKTGSNNVELTQNSAKYTGNTYVQSGGLIAGTAEKSVDLQSKLVDISPNATFAGYGSIAGDVNNKGTFIVGGLDKEELTTATSYLVKGNFNNSGSIILGSATGTGSKLNIDGNYTANGGSLYLNTVLNKGFEETETDQMVVGGNVILGAGGATSIYVKPVGGQGAYTQPDAIKIVDVAGTSDKGSFTLGAPVAIGIYEYQLFKGVQDDSWYLSSYNPVFPPDENENETDYHFVNPIIGAYLANQNALSMFNMTLHDRLGEPQYAQSLKSNNTANSIWFRSVVNGARYNAVNEQLKLDGDSQILQIGTDVINWDRWQNNGKDYRARLGVMGGFGQSDFDSTSRRTGTKASASIDNAYSAGIYGTIYQDSDRPLDSYVDAWALYNWYDDNKVGLNGYETTKYDSEGFNVSVEIGHTFLASESQDKLKQWQFQPQVQMTYGELRSDGSSHESGLEVDKSTTKSLESRVGGRMTYVDTTKVNQVQPFVEVNWLHQYEDQGLVFNDLYRFENDYPENRYQLKLGFEGNTSNNWNGWGNISYTIGDQSYKEVKAMAGFKYQW